MRAKYIDKPGLRFRVLRIAHDVRCGLHGWLQQRHYIRPALAGEFSWLLCDVVDFRLWDDCEETGSSPFPRTSKRPITNLA